MRFVAAAAMLALVFALGVQLTLVEADPIKLIELVLSQSRGQQTAWLVIALVPLVLFFIALLEHEKLRQERKTNNLLGTRLRGVRENLNSLDAGQRESEGAVNYLTRADETESINVLHERLIATDNLIELHRQRNEMTDVPARVEALRQQHETIRKKLGELITKKGAFEVVTKELQESEDAMEQTLARIEEDKNGNTLEEHVRKLTEFSRSTNLRCEHIERCMQSLMQHRDNFDALQARVGPLETEESGAKSILIKLDNTAHSLSARIESLEGDGETALVKRVQQLTDLKNQLQARVSVLEEDFAKLDTIHGEIAALFSRLNQAQRPVREMDASLRIVS
jgi:predicted  nucleic acid-binding Zn-ribbon protein